MNNGWQTRRLGDLSDLVTKGTTPTSVGHSFVTNGINFVKVESISPAGQFIEEKFAHITSDCHADLERSQLKSGDILFSIAGALGRTALVAENILPANTNQALAIIRLRDDVPLSPEFLLKVLGTGAVLEQVANFKGGVAQQNLSLAQVRDFEIPVPPVPEQQRIVGVLDKSFEGIATAKANAEKNLQNARAIFESHLAATFRQRRDGWTEEPIEAFCDVKHGFAFDGAEFSRNVPVGNPIVITPGNFTEDGRLVFGDDGTKRFLGEAPKGFRFEVGDLVVVMTDLSSKMKLLGKPAFVEAADVLHNQRIGRVVFKNDQLEHRLLYYFMLSEEYLRSIKSTATGTMVRHTAPKRILSVPIPFPRNRKDQRELVSQLDNVRQVTTELLSVVERKLSALTALKRSLLGAAFSGQL